MDLWRGILKWVIKCHATESRYHVAHVGVEMNEVDQFGLVSYNRRQQIRLLCI